MKSNSINSPYIIAKRSINLEKSHFHRFFSPVSYLSKTSTICQIVRTKFSQVLGSAIMTDNLGTLYTTSQKFPVTESTLQISQCAFDKCSNTNGNGGGVSIGTSTSSASVTITDTGFYQCSAKKAGAIYCQSKVLQVKGCCINGCTADENSGIEFESTQNDNFDMLNSYVNDIVSYSGILKTKSSLPTYKYSNFSSNTVHEGYTSSIIACEKPITIQYCLFKSNTLRNAVLLSSSEVSTFQFINMISNSALQLIFSNNIQLQINSVAFLNENSKFFAVAQKGVIVDKCKFDIPKDKARDRFSGDTITLNDDCEYDTNSKINFVLPSSDQCWVLLPDIKRPWLSFSPMVIALLCASGIILLMFLFFCRKKMCGRGGMEDTSLLIYTA